MKIAIACGGTGGHTFPGLATGRAFLRRGCDVEVLAAGRDIEAATLKGWDGRIFKTGAQPRVKNLHRQVAAFFRTVRHFRRERPDALLAMGSYASIAPVLAARWLRIPVVLHEANAVPGKANAVLSWFSTAVATSFPGGEREFACRRIVRTGLPVRRDLVGQPPAFDDAGAGRFTVFVTGGSQGAVPLNNIASAALARLAASGRVPGLRVVHQAGSRMGTLEATRKAYAEAGVDAVVEEFIPAMGGVFACADLVVARAGAATCAEICLFGVPSILVPLPSAIRDHQFLNASHLANAGAAICRRQADCSPEWLADEIAALAQDRARLAAMRHAAASLAAPDADETLADLVASCAATR